jgi:hypothetical protein
MKMSFSVRSLSIEDALKKDAPDLFSKHDVLKTKLLREVYLQWGQGFPGGNDHGPGHLERVLEKLDDLVSDETLSKKDYRTDFMSCIWR